MMSHFRLLFGDGNKAGLLLIWLVFLVHPIIRVADNAESTPRYIIYYNSKASPLSAAVNADYTHVIVSFVRVEKSEDGSLNLIPPRRMVGQWGSVQQLRAAGKKVLVSYGGGEATSQEYSPLVNRESEVAELLVQYIQKYDLDGIDIDFEASEMLHQKPPKGLANGRGFLIRLTKALRQHLPRPRYLISHAPEPPYLSPSWHGGPYLEILKSVGDEIDWINVTYYNNTGHNHPVSASPGKHTHGGTTYSALTDPLGSLAWPPEKVVVGKPVYTADAISGFVSPDKLVKTIIKPLAKKYGEHFGGLAGWQFSTLTEDHQAWNQRVGRSVLMQTSESLAPE